MPCATLQNAESSFSSAAPSWPRTSCCDARTRSTAARTSAPIAAYWPLKSNWLMDSVAAMDGTDEVMFARHVGQNEPSRKREYVGAIPKFRESTQTQI